MLKLYSPRAAERIIRRYGETIDRIAARYALPAPFIQALLFTELIRIDVLDPLADLLVRINHGNADGLLHKRDSSTGYAQIFAFVGINAINYALDRGLDTPAGLGIPGERRLRPDEAEDLRRIWFRLQRDRLFNARLAILNLMAAGEEMNGHTDFSRYGPEEIQRTLTRYNADVRHVTAYGREVYRYYTVFSAMSL